MSTKASPSDLPIRAFPTAASFETFLESAHATAPGIYLKFAKKASGIPSITGAEAVEVALCYGWIDGRANGIDDKWWTVRFTPRRAKSIWSQKNVGTVAKLIQEGRIRPAGLAAVEAAKADGRYDRAYAGPATMEVPKDFTEALETEPTAKAYFNSLNKSQRYGVLIQLATISDKNRKKKVQSLVQTMAIGKTNGTEERKESKKAAKAQNKGKAGTTAIRSSKISKIRAAPNPTPPTNKPETQTANRTRREGLRKRT